MTKHIRNLNGHIPVNVKIKIIKILNTDKNLKQKGRS